MKVDQTTHKTTIEGLIASSATISTPGKLFVGGLNWQTTQDGLQTYFGQFGEISECLIMTDPNTKRSRGFGFVTFSNPKSVEKVLSVKLHQLDAKVIDPKVAFPRRINAMLQSKMVTRTKKLFVGGLSTSSTVDDVRGYFEQYGKIEDAMLIFDKVTQRHRGFAFVTFENEESVDRVCEIHFHEISNKMVECKRAQPKELMLQSQGQSGGYLLSQGGLLPGIATNGPNYQLPGYYLPGFGFSLGQMTTAQLSPHRGLCAQRGSRVGTTNHTFIGFTPHVVTPGGVLSIINNYATSSSYLTNQTSPSNSQSFTSPKSSDFYAPSVGGDGFGYLATGSPSQQIAYPTITHTLLPTAFQNGFH